METFQRISPVIMEERDNRGGRDPRPASSPRAEDRAFGRVLPHGPILRSRSSLPPGFRPLGSWILRENPLSLRAGHARVKVDGAAALGAPPPRASGVGYSLRPRPSTTIFPDPRRRRARSRASRVAPGLPPSLPPAPLS